MKEFKGKVAVITGAASGIGRALAYRSAAEGMKVVLADIEAKALFETEKAIKETGVPAMSLVTDVAREDDINSLAQKSLGTFGSVDYLFNNAGVGGGALTWNSTQADWQWIMGVNLWGIIHAIRTFVPVMLNQTTGGYIINTASQAGLETGPVNGIYSVTKHAVVSLSETLYHEMKMINAPIGVSVLCPGFVLTQICDAERNRPLEFQNPFRLETRSPQAEMVDRMIREAVQNGISPEEMAEKTFEAIQKDQFYVFSDSSYKQSLQHRIENILNERNPSVLIPETFKKEIES